MLFCNIFRVMYIPHFYHHHHSSHVWIIDEQELTCFVDTDTSVATTRPFFWVMTTTSEILSTGRVI